MFFAGLYTLQTHSSRERKKGEVSLRREKVVPGDIRVFSVGKSKRFLSIPRGVTLIDRSSLGNSSV